PLRCAGAVYRIAALHRPRDATRAFAHPQAIRGNWRSPPSSLCRGAGAGGIPAHAARAVSRRADTGVGPMGRAARRRLGGGGQARRPHQGLAPGTLTITSCAPCGLRATGHFGLPWTVQRTITLPRAKITALGCYTPPRVLTNQDLERMVDTNDEWIMSRVGIRERHIADPGVATSDLAVAAGRVALEQRGIDASEIEVIIVCTVTPDHMFPSTACLVQNGLGAKGAWGFDLIEACSSFVFGTTTGANLVMSGRYKKVLVIGADTMSRIIDYTDRATCVLFGDGAGAVLIEPAEDGDGPLGFVDFMGEIDGSGGDALIMPAGGSRLPASHETVDKHQHFVKQDGQRVFKYAV